MNAGPLRTSDFDYSLPADRIAQHPSAERDESRLLVLPRAADHDAPGANPAPAIEHRRFRDLPGYLRPGDLLVVNDTRVIPARLFARLPREAGCASPRDVELLLVREEPPSPIVPGERAWLALARPARRLRPGLPLAFADPAWSAVVSGVGERGARRVAFRPHGALPFESWLARVGHVPIPPYIDRADEPEDRERYQTVYAREPGSVAAPTAGLHFTEATLRACRDRGAAIAAVTLHVGPGTFRPVATEDPAEHALDPEPYRVPPETAAALHAARSAGGRVIAVGTTAVRALESWARDGEPAGGDWRDTSLFVLPGFEFRVVAGMVTNFHLPKSSLLFLVSALAGRERVLAAYEEAVREGYRFYSYGDAMLIL
ncbi:MAG TPA: tRNA preQ1(34) S-adenosylmethionine ribosyltransferase-isomerase QueA [Candidatus Binatia bacterium]|nr:tRNA preQ1(34) S-adenosylmethionine ribosyltransferase-isomerase QueA [Candidatus Binatia bacterium]